MATPNPAVQPLADRQAPKKLLRNYVLSCEETACLKVSFTQAFKVLSSSAAAMLINS